MKPLISCAYFPPVAWVAALTRHTEADVEARETFPKQTFRNRMEIMTANGLRTLSVPTVRRNHSSTDEVLIDYRTRWNIIHLRTLAAAYSASPYYLYYHDDLEALLTQRYSRLIDLDMAVTQWLLDKMKVHCLLQLTTDYAHTCPIDLRTAFSPKQPLPGEWFPAYCQVFSDRLPFAPNLSALDLLMNLGPDSNGYLQQVASRLSGTSAMQS